MSSQIAKKEKVHSYVCYGKCLKQKVKPPWAYCSNKANLLMSHVSFNLSVDTQKNQIFIGVRQRNSEFTEFVYFIGLFIVSIQNAILC